jgi:hypothetical protein
MKTLAYKTVRAYAARLANLALKASARVNPDGTISRTGPTVGSVLARARVLELRDNGSVCVMADDWRETMRAFVSERALSDTNKWRVA